MIGIGRPIQSMHGSDVDVSGKNLGFVDHGTIYLTPDRMHLSQRRKRVLAQELTGFVGRALN